MGEIADDMIDGRCCAECGVYFDAEHGYPVLCSSCWENRKPDEREGYSKATNAEL